MKVRVCPSCGKVNEELAFHCGNCGQTLSIKTLMDTDSERFLKSTPQAGEVALINISPAFQEEAGRILSGLPKKESKMENSHSSIKYTIKSAMIS